ncbi:transposase [Actinokineospora sp.]|uniref:transposase n=1 Tax=Actinokineospora sp. TaxID=1872133 RepID=UPI0040377246
MLEPLLPNGKKPARPPKWTERQLIGGIRWRTRAGAPWRDVPPAQRRGSRAERRRTGSGRRCGRRRTEPAGRSRW